MHAFARTEGLKASLGAELTLYWIEGYGGGVFLPFTDATSGAETYGGGRYLLDTIKGADLALSARTARFCSTSTSPTFPRAPILLAMSAHWRFPAID